MKQKPVAQRRKLEAKRIALARHEILCAIDHLPVDDQREFLGQLRCEIDLRIAALDEQIEWAEGAAS